MIELNIYDNKGKLKSNLIKDEEKFIGDIYDRTIMYKRYENIKIEYKDVVIYNPDCIKFRYSKQNKCIEMKINHMDCITFLYLYDKQDFVYITCNEGE